MEMLISHFIIYVVFMSSVCSQDEEEVPNTTIFPTSTLQRIRNQRLSMLRNYVLESLGFSSPPQINQSIHDNMAIISLYQSQRIRESRCYLPSCILPSRINYNMWIDSDSNTMNLYFDVITFTEGDTKVVNATLKLHVKPNTGNIDDNTDLTEPRRLIVTVNQYVKPLKRRRKKIKLMDVSMVIWSSYGYWVAFNVTEAAGEWGLDVKKNNGFLIQIQSISEQLNITDVFGLPDCTAPLDIDCSSTDIPFPFRGSSNAMLEIFTERNIFK